MRKRKLLNQFYSVLPLLIVLVIEFTVVGLLIPGYFSMTHFMSLARQTSITSIVAMGMAYVLIAGGLDMSFSARVSFTGMLGAWLMVMMGIATPVALLIAISAGTTLGVVNGYICTKVDIHPFILTMALSIIYGGMAKIVNGGMPIYNLPEGIQKIERYDFGGIPAIVLVMLCLLALGTYVLKFTYLGKYIYAVGEDEKTAEISGIDTVLVKRITYGVAGVYGAIASILLVSKVGSAQPVSMSGIELDVLAAAAIGGISFKGGKGNLINVVLGVVVIEMLGNALIVMDVGEYYRSIFKGLILLVALSVDGLKRIK